MGILKRFRERDGYERWLVWTEWPLVVLGLLFLAVLILPLATPLTDAEQTFLDVANVVIWFLFVVDYFLRLYLASDRRRFVRTHVLDLIVIAVPFLRPFRLLRLLAILMTTTRRAGGLAVRRVTLYVIGVAVIMASVGAVVVYDAEKNTPEAERTVRTLGDAFWWALITVTTIGYGDTYPKSAAGRGFAAILMVVGIALIGTITAAVASWFVNVVRTASTEAATQAGTDDRAQLLAAIGDLSARVDQLTADMRAITSVDKQKDG